MSKQVVHNNFVLNIRSALLQWQSSFSLVRNTPKKLPLVAAMVMAFGVLFLPQKTKHQAIKYIAYPLVIQAVKDSPPYIALREAMMDEESVWEIQNWNSLKAKTVTYLEAGRPAPSYQPSSIAQEVKPTQQKTFESRAALAGVKEDILSFSASPEEQDHSEENWQEGLSRTQLQRLNLANDRHQLLEQNWNPPSFKELAAKAIAEVDINKASDADKKVLVYNPQNPKAQGPDRPSVEIRKQEANSSSVVVGNIKLEAGAMLGPDDTIEVRKFEEGIPKEVGSVNLLESIYRIEVGSPTGVIAAHLVNKDGKVVAKGTYRLSSDKTLGAKQDTTIVLRPIDKHVTGQFYSADSFGGNKPAAIMGLDIENTDEKTKTDKSGSFSIERLAAGSTILARGAGANWAKINALISVGRDYRLPALPSKMLTSLKTILRESQVQSSMYENNSLIWGRVVTNGKIQQGVKVEIEGYPDLKPVYLNALWIPDPKLEATTENGLFVFENIPEGFQSLLVTKFDAYFAHQNVVIERDTVSVTEIETSPTVEAVDIKVFDALTGAPETATVAFQSYPEDLQITGYLRIEVPYIHQTSLAFVRPNEEYEPMLVTYHDKADYIHVPLIRGDWLQALKNSQRVDDAPDTGTVVGFVNDEAFEVYLSRNAGSENAHIVFFDATGAPTEGNKGVAGGGFVIFNVDTGSQSVVVIGQQTNQVFTQMIPVDPDKLTLMGAILK